MRIFFAIIFVLLQFQLLTTPTFAQNPNAEIPEKNGDYPDPQNKGIRVRVFVHEPKEKVTTSVSAVCSADEGSNAVVGSTGWKLPAGNWVYRLNTSSVPLSVGGGNLANITSAGFSAWTTAVTTGAPNLVYGGATTKDKSAYDGQNIIAWGRPSSGALGVTYTRYYTSSGIVVDVDTIMNKKFQWSLNTCSSNTYDAANILIHELGHWFGMNDEYTANYIHNTMYGYGSKAENKKVTLTNGDKSGINLIYY